MEGLSFIITFLIYLLVGVPVCLMLHELGHACMILLLTQQKVTFQFGVRGTKREFRLGRLTILLYFEPSTFLGSRYYLENRAALARYQDFWITIGGPLSSLLFTVLCGVLWWALDGGDPWEGLTLINLANFLWASIPQNYPEWQGAQAGIPNDALQLIQLQRSSR